jgi:hypothetical protein
MGVTEVEVSILSKDLSVKYREPLPHIYKVVLIDKS